MVQLRSPNQVVIPELFNEWGERGMSVCFWRDFILSTLGHVTCWRFGGQVVVPANRSLKGREVVAGETRSLRRGARNRAVGRAVGLPTREDQMSTLSPVCLG
jgi:hypothetical protein